MGDSHFKSNVLGKAGTETIRQFATISATTIEGSTSVHGATVSANALNATTLNISNQTLIAAGQSIKLGAHQYIVFGNAATAAAVEASVADVDASCKGSLYISTDGVLWIMTADDTATSFAV